ncbi:MAG: HAD-IIB family hydrolase [Oscillospiraceae bacterium]|nr:HAD-IIB family hydrolase [Oscillospiraceae bacterium]
MKKAVFFDIDGTLVTDDGTSVIPESAVNAVRALRENGSYAFINTGRSMMNVEGRIRDIGFDGYICGCGTYISINDEVLFYRTVETDICRKTAALARECDMNPLYERADKFFRDPSCRALPDYKALMSVFDGQDKDLTYTVNDDDFGFDKFVAWYDEKSDLEKFKNGIADNFEYIDRGYGFCEIIPKGYTKASGIDEVCSLLNIEHKDTYAVGDSLNDLDMLRGAGHAIVMGNGREELFKYAELVTKDITDGGIEYALKYFKLI